MRKVGIKYVQPGMKLVEGIYTTSGGVIIHGGSVLGQAEITKLESLGIVEVYIHDPRVDDVDIIRSISEETSKKAIATLKDFYASICKAREPSDIEVPYDRISDAVRSMDRDLGVAKNDIVTLIDVKSLNEYMYIYPLNVATLSMMIAKKAGYGLRVFDIGVGALLCDIGMIFIDENIRDKPGDLAPEQALLVRKHPEFGIRVLRLSNRFTSYSRAIVFQHHERYDGSGYPKGLRGPDIDPLARITGLANTYCACVSQRSNRQRMMPHEAIEYIMSSVGFEFDHGTVQQLLQHVVPYPVGTMVRLNTGEKGVVVKVTKGIAARPVVRAFYGPGGEELSELYEIDLAAPENQTRLIAEVCAD